MFERETRVERILATGQLGAELPQETGQDIAAPSLTETVVSTIKKENPVYNVGVALGSIQSKENNIFDPEYDPFADIEGTPYERFAGDFVSVNNRNQAEILKSRLDMKMDSEATIQAAGTGKALVAGLANGLLDPFMLLAAGPVGESIKAGTSLLKIGAEAGLIGGASIAGSEAVLQATQEGRTAEESAINIAGGVVLSGLLGAGAGGLYKYLSKSEIGGLENQITSSLTVTDDPIPGLSSELKSLSSAAANQVTFEQETLKSAGGLISASAKLNPTIRLATSPSMEVRQIAESLIENPLTYNKNAEFIATDTAVETLMKEYNAGLADGLESLKSTYKQHRRTGGKLAYKDFKEAVSAALRRGDVGADDSISTAARTYRAKVFEPLKNRAVQAGLLPEGIEPKTAESYLTRFWNKKAVVEKEDQLRGILTKWLDDEYMKVVQSFRKSFDERLAKKETELATKKSKGSTEEQLAKIRQQIAEIKAERDVTLRTKYDIDEGGKSYLSDTADEIINTLKGYGEGGWRYDKPVAIRGPLKDRTLNIPDVLIEDFLVKDIEEVAARYTRTMSADVEMQMKFGNTTLEEQIKSVNDSYAAMAKAAGTPKERSKIEARRRADIRDIEAMRDLLRGDYKRALDPDSIYIKSLYAARALQYMSKLGGVVISSIPDVANLVIRHGLFRTFKDSLVPMVAKRGAYKLSKEEARKAGQITESILNGRIATMAEINDPYATGTAFSRWVDNASAGFSKATGMSLWNDTVKGMASVITQQRILDGAEALAKGGTLSKSDMTFLAKIGIDENAALEMYRAFKKSGRTVDGIKIAGTDQWDDNLRRLYRAAINKSVDSTVVVKGVGDVPLAFNNEVGKTILQFKSFAFAAHNRILLAGLQDRDAAAITGMVTAIALGMGVAHLKAIAGGYEPPEGVGQNIAEGLDRSGLIAVIMEVNNIAERAGVPGISRALGGQPVSRFANRNVSDLLTGPSGGMLQDAFTTSRAITTGEVSRSDIKAARRLIPAQNLFYIRGLFDEAEEGIASELGAK